MTAPATSTLTGYVPEVGDLVWQQMWSPTAPHPHSSIEERVTHGEPYGARRQMIVREIIENYDADAYSRSLAAAPETLPPRLVTRWVLQETDPTRCRGECRGFSWVEDDWCVLELVDPATDGRLW